MYTVSKYMSKVTCVCVSEWVSGCAWSNDSKLCACRLWGKLKYGSVWVDRRAVTSWTDAWCSSDNFPTLRMICEPGSAYFACLGVNKSFSPPLPRWGGHRCLSPQTNWKLWMNPLSRLESCLVWVSSFDVPFNNFTPASSLIFPTPTRRTGTSLPPSGAVLSSGSSSRLLHSDPLPSPRPQNIIDFRPI